MIDRSADIGAALRRRRYGAVLAAKHRQRGGFIVNPYRFGLQPDSSFSSVVLLTSAAEANNSTTVVDVSNSARTCTATGNAKNVTSNFKYGSSSIDLDGTSSTFVSCADTPDINFTTAFTIEVFAYLSSIGGANRAMLSLGGVNWEFYCRGTSSSTLTLWDGSANRIIGSSMSTSVWYHCAWSWDGSTHRTFLDGSLQGSYSSGTAINPTSIRLGSYTDGSERLIGQIHARITNGVCRWTGNFTPPTYFATS